MWGRLPGGRRCETGQQAARKAVGGRGPSFHRSRTPALRPGRMRHWAGPRAALPGAGFPSSVHRQGALHMLMRQSRTASPMIAQSVQHLPGGEISGLQNDGARLLGVSNSGAWIAGTRRPQLGAARRRVFHSVGHQPKGRESQTKRQRRGGEPACVFVFKLFSSPRSPGSHMLPPTSPGPSHDTGPPSCDETNLPNFGPPPPPPARRLTDKVLEEVVPRHQ